MQIKAQRATGIIIEKDDEMLFLELNGTQRNFKLTPASNADMESFYEVDRHHV